MRCLILFCSRQGTKDIPGIKQNISFWNAATHFNSSSFCHSLRLNRWKGKVFIHCDDLWSLNTTQNNKKFSHKCVTVYYKILNSHEKLEQFHNLCKSSLFLNCSSLNTEFQSIHLWPKNVFPVNEYWLLNVVFSRQWQWPAFQCP